MSEGRMKTQRRGTSRRTILNSLAITGAVAFSLGLAACSGDPEPPPGDEGIAYTFAISQPGATGAFYREALERSNEKHGYKGEWLDVATSEVGVSGVASNQFQAGAGVTATVMAAQQAQDADIVFVGDFIKQQWTVAGTDEIESCDDLQGVRFGLHSPGGVSTALFKAWMDENCAPGVQPELLYVEGSGNRLQGVLAGQLDAAMMELDDTLALTDGYHIIGDLATELPGIAVNNVFFNGTFAKEHPEVVDNLLEEMILLVQEFEADPEVYAELIKEWVPELSDQADAIAETYLEIGLFDATGGTQIDDMKKTLALFESVDAVGAGLVIEDVVDRSHLERALEATK